MSEQIIPYNSWMLGGIGGRDVGSDMFKFQVGRQCADDGGARKDQEKMAVCLGPDSDLGLRVFVLMLERGRYN